jgi:hypothetical protein
MAEAREIASDMHDPHLGATRSHHPPWLQELRSCSMTDDATQKHGPMMLRKQKHVMTAPTTRPGYRSCAPVAPMHPTAYS